MYQITIGFHTVTLHTVSVLGTNDYADFFNYTKIVIQKIRKYYFLLLYLFRVSLINSVHHGAYLFICIFILATPLPFFISLSPTIILPSN